MLQEDVSLSGPEWTPLISLFGGYLNPDFDLDYADWREAVSAFRDESRSLVAKSIEKLSELLRLAKSEKELEEAMDRLGLDRFNFPVEGMMYRRLIESVSDILAGSV